MPDASSIITPLTTTKQKRARKAPKPRTPRVKDEAILAIEAQAKAAKDEYRKSQASGGVLKRILEKMLPRLTESHLRELYDGLCDQVTPALLPRAYREIAKDQKIKEDAEIASAQ
jgi:hypothetical protein